jgi:hypothetical protein
VAATGRGLVRDRAHQSRRPVRRSAGGDIRTKQTFGDFTLHAEFWLPNLPADVTGQARANSGVYLQDRYEVQ